MLKEANSSATISPSSKILHNFMSTMFNDSDYNYSMDYMFTAKELKEFINTITRYAAKVSHRPHGRVQRKLKTMIQSLQQELEDKKEYIEPTTFKEIELQLNRHKEIVELKDREIATLKSDNTKYSDTIESKVKIISTQKDDLAMQSKKIDDLVSKATLLQKQKRELTKKVKEILNPPEDDISSTTYHMKR